ncbi:hypothetical protein FIBSPDRAFT_1042043 [Athelia psychrophila]|uniref:Uncharacterized protein n=1 Tax=Athelia psychrophila TaxID=1759441 RepID=A0A166N2F3_9AGAM|nr:hypothetical protein FIBSPDRAFT_1042043 [Fibularhizoctonia sp. CBS 109695]
MLFHARHILAPILLRPTAGIRRAHNPLSFRDFSTTPAPQAAESDSFIDRFRHTETFKKLADKPDVLAALSEFAGKMKEQGIEMGTGKMPSKMQMLRLATNSEFRAAAQKVVEELKNAGVDLNSADAMQEIMGMQKSIDTPGKDS